MPEIAIIIVTYNAMKWAEKCFNSLKRSSVTVNPFIIDNGSTDGTQEYLKTYFPEAEFIQSAKNLGFGKANNLGLEIAYKKGAEFFYLMNQDAWLYENSIEKLLEVYEKYPQKQEIGIISPMHIDGTEQQLDIFLDKYIATNFEKTRLISDLYFQNLKPYYEISFVNAAHWFIPKSTIDTVGGFNPYFFHYGEDVEYANRVKFHQKKILLAPGSQVVHDGKQILSKVDYALYEDLTIETNIINPSFPNALELEKKSLKQGLVKSILTGNKKTRKKLLDKYRKISKEEKKLIEIANTVKEVGKTFLNV
ncbi:glycosyltransferase family 2 protein [Chryseobacterium sp. GMJ5]|uniref:Glycosyltransferase family 2 protein n=1 Tax=Chryseobacterium gilvum TaxID=2976534 RepID=A0ABT2W0K5_9FLAO|nr:glycosyltransferase family 2 protein [Chryseobacterium gilvum]MCU7614255.1 glycosyltransferase family 2 protein [Chryseobacterium gilvum]